MSSSTDIENMLHIIDNELRTVLSVLSIVFRMVVKERAACGGW